LRVRIITTMEASAPVTTITMISTRQELMKREEIKT
jgi:hypothetical protein